METLPKREFQVGWVCALLIEAATAILMLDRKFDILEEQRKSDTNIYILARISQH